MWYIYVIKYILKEIVRSCLQDRQPERKAEVMSWRGGYESAPVDEEVGHRGGVFWFPEPGDWNLSLKKAESSEG